ncbi:MAG TPA: hypothetical protein VIK33_14755 [Anaerolineae bacterium]
MSRPLGVIEDIDQVRRIPIGRFWGIRLTVTPIAWLGPIIFFGLGFGVTLLTRPELSLAERVSTNVLSALAVELGILAHAFGHILSGKLIGSAMDELLMATTRDINLYYGDQSGYPSRVHIVRSLGGPVFNLVLLVVLAALYPTMTDSPARELVGYLVSVNTVLGVGSFLPIPSVDGEVIWREVIKSLAKRASA